MLPALCSGFLQKQFLIINDNCELYNMYEAIVAEKKYGSNLHHCYRTMLVREAGLEPARPEWTLEPESSESTNSTTRACQLGYNSTPFRICQGLFQKFFKFLAKRVQA